MPILMVEKQTQSVRFCKVFLYEVTLQTHTLNQEHQKQHFSSGVGTVSKYMCLLCMLRYKTKCGANKTIQLGF